MICKCFYLEFGENRSCPFCLFWYHLKDWKYVLALNRPCIAGAVFKQLPKPDYKCMSNKLSHLLFCLKNNFELNINATLTKTNLFSNLVTISSTKIVIVKHSWFFFYSNTFLIQNTGFWTVIEYLTFWTLRFEAFWSKITFSFNVK